LLFGGICIHSQRHRRRKVCGFFIGDTPKGGANMSKHYTQKFRRDYQQTSLSRQTTEALPMLPNEMDYLVRQEQLKDHLRRMEQVKLIRLIKPPAPELHRKIIVGVGAKLITWGKSLQQYGAAHPKTKTA
jgi:hypothetical protein